MGVVTLSASYGAGGPEIAPAVAERLGLPFHDRVIPVKVAARLGVPVEEIDELASQSTEELVSPAPKIVEENEPTPAPTDPIGSEDWDDTEPA